MKKLQMTAFNGFAISPKFVFGGTVGSGGGTGTAEGPAQAKVIWMGCINGYSCTDYIDDDGKTHCGVKSTDGAGNHVCD